MITISSEQFDKYTMKMSYAQTLADVIACSRGGVCVASDDPWWGTLEFLLSDLIKEANGLINASGKVEGESA